MTAFGVKYEYCSEIWYYVSVERLTVKTDTEASYAVCIYILLVTHVFP